MEKAVLVHERQTLEDLHDNVLYDGLSEWLLAVLDQLVEILFHVLEHKVQSVVFADDFLQLDEVCMAQLLQRLQRPKKMHISRPRSRDLIGFCRRPFAGFDPVISPFERCRSSLNFDPGGVEGE